jgi:hypothetical protein
MSNNILEKDREKPESQERAFFDPSTSRLPLNWTNSPWQSRGGEHSAPEIIAEPLSIFLRLLEGRNWDIKKELTIASSVACAGLEYKSRLQRTAVAASKVNPWAGSVVPLYMTETHPEKLIEEPTLEYAQLVLFGGWGQNTIRNMIEGILADYKVLIPDQAEIVAYLGLHRDLGQVLISVFAEARKEFGQEAELTLQVYRDPEIDDHYLRLNIRLPFYDESIMKRLDKVSQPFDKELAKASGYLLVTTDFRIPETNNGV